MESVTGRAAYTAIIQIILFISGIHLGYDWWICFIATSCQSNLSFITGELYHNAKLLEKK